LLSVNKTNGRLRLVRLITLPGPLASAWGMTVSPDGRLLVVAGGTGAAVLSLPKLESGAAHPVLGVLPVNSSGVFEAAVSRTGRSAPTGGCGSSMRPEPSERPAHVR
jgi:hypothetical protein